MKVLAITIMVSTWSLWADTVSVSVKFDSQEEAKEFMSYMSGQGEQDMIPWMEESVPSLVHTPSYDYENLVIDFSKK